MLLRQENRTKTTRSGVLPDTKKPTRRTRVGLEMELLEIWISGDDALLLVHQAR